MKQPLHILSILISTLLVWSSLTVDATAYTTENNDAATSNEGPNFDMVGFATVNAEGLETTTGGAGGTVTTVTTLQELIDYSKTRENETDPGILYIKGKISAPTSTVISIKHGANISILGEGEYGELENVGLKIWKYKNVIVRNLKIHEVLYPNDALTIDECQHVWIDHNELYSKIGSGIGVDTYDGLLDIKNGSRYVTVSWNNIHHHMKTSLIGHTDNSNQAATDSQFKITYHHNYFHDTDGRNPSIRFGTIHLFNNYFENITDYGIAVRQGAHALLENNHYHNVYTPITTNKFNGPDGFVCESGTIYTGGTTEANNSITQVDCDFWNDLPYSYNLDPTNTVALMVQEYGGVGIINTDSTVSLSSNANLSTLSASTGQLEPSFDPLSVYYVLGVSEGTESVTISAETEDPDASVTGTGEYSELPGTATITVTAEDGTLKIYEVEITLPVATDEFAPDQISIYPNPVTDILYINNMNDGIIEIFNLNGSLIRQFDQKAETVSVDMKSMPQGIYMIKIKSGNSTEVKKIIKR